MRNEATPSLPVVSESVVNAHMHDFLENPSAEFVREVFEEFRRDQPELSKSIFSYAESSAENRSEYSKMVTVALFMYELLSRQAEADEMNRRLLD